MTWLTPKVVEIAVGMEINCYACAELKGSQRKRSFGPVPPAAKAV